MNDFAEFWVATSDSKTDDLLEFHCNKKGLRCFRGDENNVVKRFADLCSQRNINDEDVVIRLTADNPVVDHFFLENMRNVWENHNLSYLSGQPADIKKMKWPYGLSAEFFYAKFLYQANNAVIDRYSTEHVTPYMKETTKEYVSMSDFMKFDFDINYNCSVDTLNDYLEISDIFKNKNWDTPYMELIKEIQK